MNHQENKNSLNSLKAEGVNILLHAQEGNLIGLQRSLQSRRALLESCLNDLQIISDDGKIDEDELQEFKQVLELMNAQQEKMKALVSTLHAAAKKNLAQVKGVKAQSPYQFPVSNRQRVSI